jgi:class 3 adenylate cyclase
MPPVRRLTAILAADVAGYSRLMGADEAGTHERLKAHLRELVHPKIVGINLGDVIAELDDIYGDGVNVAARLEALAERWHLCVASGARPDQRQTSLPVRGQGRAERQEYRSVGAGLRVAARSDRRIAGGGCTDLSAASPPSRRCSNGGDRCSGDVY